MRWKFGGRCRAKPRRDGAKTGCRVQFDIDFRQASKTRQAHTGQPRRTRGQMTAALMHGPKALPSILLSASSVEQSISRFGPIRMLNLRKLRSSAGPSHFREGLGVGSSGPQWLMNTSRQATRPMHQSLTDGKLSKREALLVPLRKSRYGRSVPGTEMTIWTTSASVG